MSEYLRIRFRNSEPIRIANDSSSQSGQTVTLRYIPGSALRGVVVNALVGEDDFESIRKELFSTNVRYLNAYLTDGNTELLPSPKGFYEDKTEAKGKKAIDNVVIDGEFEEGKKRAGLGSFGRIEDGCIYYSSVDTSSDLKIKINDEEKNIFRNEYICSGYTFTAYIAVPDRILGDRIKKAIENGFTIGNGRSAGYGKCRVTACEYAGELPYASYLPKEDQSEECYMFLLSDTVMRDENGELCGLDMAKLAEKMGVAKLETAFCATSTVEVKGYNSKWRTKIPSAVMYEKGSVFHLRYNGVLSQEKMRELCDSGIGIRRNEGFGRILFMNDYEAVHYKQAAPVGKTLPERGRQAAGDEEALKIAAACYYRNLLERGMKAYIVDNPLHRGKLADSQLGIVNALATAYQYKPREAKQSIEKYFEHALEKEENNSVQKAKNSFGELKRFVRRVFDTELDELLGIRTKQEGRVMGVSKSDFFSEEENLRWKLKLIVGMIRYENKEEA